MGEEIRRKAKVVHKHETAANWALSNYVPEIGEIVFYDPDDEFDYTRQKNGNGVDKVADLPFENDEVKTYIDEKTAGYTVTLDDHNLKTVEIGAENSLKLISGTGVNIMAPDGVYIASGDKNIELNPISEQISIGDKPVATEEYVNEAIANIDVSGGEVTIPEDLTINSLVIGEGEASELSIAGGTTDRSFIEDIINSEGILGNLASYTLPLNPSKAEAPLSISLGATNTSSASGAVTFGYGNTSSGWCSTAVGAMNEVSGSTAFAYGYDNTVSGDFGVAFGQENIAGIMAIAGGVKSEATGKGSFALGNQCIASGEYSVALGGDNTASGTRAIAEGDHTLASADFSHASGSWTRAEHNNSFATGLGTRTGRDNQVVVGQYNKISNKALFVVGDGGSNDNRTNILEVNDDGTATLNDKPIATKEYIDSKISALRDEIKAYINEVFLNGAW